jgi:hypothetical protein
MVGVPPPHREPLTDPPLHRARPCRHECPAISPPASPAVPGATRAPDHRRMSVATATRHIGHGGRRCSPVTHGPAVPAVACAAITARLTPITSCRSRKVDRGTTLPMVNACVVRVTVARREPSRRERQHRRTQHRTQPPLARARPTGGAIGSPHLSTIKTPVVCHAFIHGQSPMAKWHPVRSTRKARPHAPQTRHQPR